MFVPVAIFVSGIPSLPDRRLHWLYWLLALAAEIGILAVVVWRRPQEFSPSAPVLKSPDRS